MISKTSRRRSTALYLFFNYAVLGLVLVQGVVLVPVYLRYIDSVTYGAWLATGNVVSILGMFDLGLSSVLLQRSAHLSGSGNVAALGKSVGSALLLLALLALIPPVAGFAVAPWIGAIVNLEGGGEASGSLATAFVLAAVATGLMLFTYGGAAVLSGLQRQVVSGVAAVGAVLAGIGATVWMLVHGYGLLAIPLGMVARAVVLFVFTVPWMFIVLRRILPPGVLRHERQELRSLAKVSTTVFSGGLASGLTLQSDALIVAVSSNPRQTTVFALTRKAADLVVMLAMRLSSSAVPGLSHLGGEGSMTRLRATSRVVLKVSIFSALLGLGGVALLNREFMDLWVGREQYGGAALTVLFCVAGLLQVVGSSFYSILFAHGAMTTAARAQMLEAAIRIPLGVWLGMRFGPVGVAAAAIMAAVPASLVVLGSSVAALLDVRRAAALVSGSRILGVGLIPLVLCLFVKPLFAEDPSVRLAALGSFYCVTAVATYVLADRDVRHIATAGVNHLRHRFSLR